MLLNLILFWPRSLLFFVQSNIQAGKHKCHFRSQNKSKQVTIWTHVYHGTLYIESVWTPDYPMFLPGVTLSDRHSSVLYIGMQRIIYLSTLDSDSLAYFRQLWLLDSWLYLSQYWMVFAAICVILKVLYRSKFGCIKWWFESSVTWVITWWLLTLTLFARMSVTSQESIVMTPDSCHP